MRDFIYGLYLVSSDSIYTDVLVTGTISGENAGVLVNENTTPENFELTVWNIESNSEGCVAVNTDGNCAEEVEAKIRYIINVTGSQNNYRLTDQYGNSLETPHGYPAAKMGDTVCLHTADSYDGTGLTDGNDGNCQIVSKGGAVSFTVDSVPAVDFFHNLETRLRKSGWVYQGPMEYHAKRMTLAILFFIIPVALGMILKGSFLTVALLATGAAVFGFITPDRKIVSATNARKKTIQREMGFGLEQISLMLTSGEQLEKALSSAKKTGEFGQICEHIAVGKATNRTIGDIIAEIKVELPEISVMNEFLELVRMESKGQNLVEPFRVMAMLQRDRLENEIIEAGGKAKVTVTMLTSAFVMMSSLFVLIGPIFIIMQNTGF